MTERKQRQSWGVKADALWQYGAALEAKDPLAAIEIYEDILRSGPHFSSRVRLGRLLVECNLGRSSEAAQHWAVAASQVHAARGLGKSLTGRPGWAGLADSIIFLCCMLCDVGEDAAEELDIALTELRMIWSAIPAWLAPYLPKLCAAAERCPPESGTAWNIVGWIYAIYADNQDAARAAWQRCGHSIQAFNFGLLALHHKDYAEAAQLLRVAAVEIPKAFNQLVTRCWRGGTALVLPHELCKYLHSQCIGLTAEELVQAFGAEKEPEELALWLEELKLYTYADACWDYMRDVGCGFLDSPVTVCTEPQTFP